MTATTPACSRCGKLVPLTVTDEETSDKIEQFNIDLDGLLLVVCRECMTDAEQLQKAKQAAVEMLDVAEEAIANFEMVFERVPSMRDHPEAKQAYAEAKEHAERAQQMLDDLNRSDT